MKIKTKLLSIRAKLGFGVLLAMAIGITAYLFIVIPTIKNLLISNAIDVSQKDARIVGKRLQDKINLVTQDVISLAKTPPVQGIMRAEDGEGMDDLGGSTYEQWKERLENIFVGSGLSKGYFYQLRYLDETGQELVRVDIKNNQAVIVPSEELQNKSDRYYFYESVGLPEGTIYVSNIDLNREGNPPMIEKPFVPVVRYSYPVHDEGGKSRGIIIANVFANTFLESLPVRESQDFIIVDKDGYYLNHPDGEKEWGAPNDLNKNENIKNDFSDNIVENIFSNQDDTVEFEDFVISYYNIDIAQGSDKQIVLIKVVEKSEILVLVGKVIETTIVTAIFVGIVLVAIIFLMVSLMLKPLSSLSQASERVGSGDFTRQINIQSNDEIGTLAKSFNLMMVKLKDYYKELEQTVAQRTNQLNVKIKIIESNNREMEDQQKAILNILEDIEDEKSNVTQERDKIDAILHSIGDGVFVVDKDLIITMYNKTAGDISGYLEKEALGKKYYDVLKFIFEDSGKDNKAFVTETVETGKIHDMSNHTLIVRKDGSKVPVADSAAPLIDRNNEVIGCVVVFRDISKEREVDKMKTEFLSVASHQLRTPLGSMRWNLEMLANGDLGSLPSEAEDTVKQVYESNQRMLGLVNDLLDVSRIEQGRVSDVPVESDIVEIVNKAVDEIQPLAKDKKVKVEFQVKDARLPKIMIDPKRLREVVQNLLSNAVKYNKPGGTAKILIEKENTNVRVEIKDSGMGIPKQDQSKLFTKFFRAENAAKSETEGSGLGLFVVKSYVESWGGKVDFESHEGKGTKFTITLPLSPKQQSLDKNLEN